MTQRNKPRLVLLNIEDYRRLTLRAEIRNVYTIETMPDEMLEDFKRGLQIYAREGEED